MDMDNHDKKMREFIDEDKTLKMTAIRSSKMGGFNRIIEKILPLLGDQIGKDLEDFYLNTECINLKKPNDKDIKKGNEIDSLSDIELTDFQKKRVLEWYAKKAHDLSIDLGGSSHCKGYDPLRIWDHDDDYQRDNSKNNELSSYVYDITSDDRHQEWDTLKQVEEGLDKAIKEDYEYLMEEEINKKPVGN